MSAGLGRAPGCGPPTPTGRLTLYGPSAVLTWANAITIGRVVLLPFLIWAMVERADGIALAIWIVLGLSDSLDGVIARRQGATRSGAYLDPLADKVVILTALVILAAHGRAPWIAVGLMTAREAVISWWRSQVARRGESLPASRGGKVKTFLQNVAVGWYLVHLESLGHVTLWLAVAVALVSGADYLMRSRAPRAPVGE